MQAGHCTVCPISAELTCSGLGSGPALRLLCLNLSSPASLLSPTSTLLDHLTEGWRCGQMCVMLPGELLLLVPAQHGLQQLEPLLQVRRHWGQRALHQLQPLLQLAVSQRRSEKVGNLSSCDEDQLYFRPNYTRHSILQLHSD